MARSFLGRLGENLTRLERTTLSVTSDRTLGFSEDVILASGTLTVTLPNFNISPFRTPFRHYGDFTIKNVGSGDVTVATSGSQTIDGSSTVSLDTQYGFITVVHDGLNWHVVARHDATLD